MVNLVMFYGKSTLIYIYIKKSNSSNTDPWGTPKIRVDISELKPLIETDCFRSVKYDSNYLFDIPVIP